LVGLLDIVHDEGMQRRVSSAQKARQRA